ncbi:MAG: class I SAM-dependent methyltransferase [Gammaproteobacteria bacterium]|nr:MAG: class I SAM-dependent methyltransferase [Gammaproteobacteria bacterium]
MVLRALTAALVRPFGYTTVRTPRGFRISRRHSQELVYLHDYAGGYEEYRATQVFHNQRKLDAVWADEGTLQALATHLLQHHPEPRAGICHGARNGYEVELLGRLTGAKMIGTDIAETATRFPNMVVWDFHQDNPEWHGRFDFVYTNSLDQAMQPQRALAAWARQLAPGGHIYIEHTMQHSAAGASEMDPFGAHPMCMPYLFFQWGRGLYRLVDILEPGPKRNNRKPVWMFVLEREPGA